MELVIGGSYQGKLDYVKSISGYTSEEVFDASFLYEKLNDNLSTFTNESISNRMEEHSLYIHQALETLYEKPIVNHFHLLIKSLLKLQIDPYPIINNICKNSKNLFIISDEIGSGIVPLLSSDREYREQTGRILCLLAKEANHVHRVILGIGTRIK